MSFFLKRTKIVGVEEFKKRRTYQNVSSLACLYDFSLLLVLFA